MIKIYTKTGDKGETSLLNGKRVSKCCIEMKAVGEVDELNTSIGMIISELKNMDYAKVTSRLTKIQHRLFTLGSTIAAVQTDLNNIPSLTEKDIEVLEGWIDQLESDLDPLNQFILPGGHKIAAQSFYARAICRRAERHVVELRQRYEDMDLLPQKYLNRLSDFLFVFGRWVNKKFEVEEDVWKK